MAIPQIKKILYATDLSKNSSYAFLYAIDVAKKHDARIVILHAVEPIPAYAEVHGDHDRRVQEKTARGDHRVDEKTTTRILQKGRG